MKTVVVTQTIIVRGHKTRVSLEHPFWRGLKEVAAWRDMSLNDLLDSIDSERESEDLSSSIRLVVLNFYRHQLFAADHLLRSVAPLPNLEG
jgi:predicted DNA-binding ribbon-helix-helix protein